MTAPRLNAIEIFKPGRHTPKAGGARQFSVAELQQAANVYDPALHRAPFVIGHPKTDDLAYGHAGALSYSEEAQRLIADPADVEPAFAEMVADGRLLAVSASFYTPDSPSNPVPGSLYLRHVGFLGAEPPAVKGLKRPSVNFSEAEEGVVEFSDWTASTTASLFRGLRDWLIGQFGLEKADQALPAWGVQSLADDATADATRAMATTESQPQATGLSYAEGSLVSKPTPEELQAQAAQITADRAKLDADRAAFDASQRSASHAARLAEFSEFLGGLVKDGCRLLPAQAAGLAAVMGALPPQTEVVEFAEAPGSTDLVKKPAVQVMQEFLRTLPRQVDFSERAGSAGEGRDDEAAATGSQAEGVALARVAVEFQEAETKAGRTVTLEAAVQHVSNKQKG